MPLSQNEYYVSLVKQLVQLGEETEWLEFKCSNKDPERIAEYISGLSNSAALLHQPKAYLIWGVDDQTHSVIGTSFRYRKAKKGNEELEAWLNRMISPKINIHFAEVLYDGNLPVVILEIPCAETEPVKYGSVPYIRVGSNLKPLTSYKEKEAQLWKSFDSTPAELHTAREKLTAEEVVQLLDYDDYYRIQELPIPTNPGKVMNDLAHEKFITVSQAGTYSITCLGALMIARDFNDFEKLGRKSVRIIRYQDDTRKNGIEEITFSKGYIASFQEMLNCILSFTSTEEIGGNGIRRTICRYPETAIRELLANMIIHQDLNQRGTNPMVEIFDSRIEFSNPGAPLISISRIIDTVPLSRNENMAGFMHRCGICEERGSGYDKIVEATSTAGLLAPKIENQNNLFTKVVLFAKIPFSLTTKEDRIWTCYMRTCLAYVSFTTVSNSDIRELFGLSSRQKVTASRIIKDTMEAELIKPVDPLTAPRYMKYIPFWA